MIFPIPTEYRDVVRSDEVLSTLVLILRCHHDVFFLLPSPSFSWFKDGQPFHNIFNDPIIEESFLAQKPILMPGVFDVPPLSIILIGYEIHLSTRFTNIANPMLGGLVPDTTLPEARQLVLDTLLGNWTCFVNNSLGSASVEYIIRELGKLVFVILLSFFVLIINHAPPIVISFMQSIISSFR